MEHEPSRWRRSLGPLALLASCAVVLAPLAFGGVLGGVDVLRQELDFRSLLSEALGAFELPHWNPYVLCGTPHLASMSGGPLHPLHLALAPWLSPAAAINVSVALSLIAAAFGAWLLARRLAEHRAAALAGGLLFALGGVMLGHLEAGHVSLVATYALLPWVALALDRLQQRPEPARLLVAGVALALFVLSGHPQLIVLGGLGLVALLRLRSWLSPAHRGPRRWVFIAASGGLGALLSAHQWLPALHFAARSGRARSDDPLFHQLGTFAARDLLQLLAPATLGPRPGALPWETCAFIGVVGLTLALAAALTRQKGALALCALAGLATGLAFGPLQAVIPGLSLFRVPGRFVVLLALALAALAVWGLAAAGPRLTLAAAGVVAALALSLGLALEAELVSVAGYALRVALPLAALGALSVAALRGRLALERWRWLVVGLLTVELVIGGMGRLRTKPAPPPIPSAIARHVRLTAPRESGRALLLDPLPLNAGVRARLLTIGGYIPAASERFRRYFALAAGYPPARQLVRFTTRRLSPGLVNLGMRWIVAPKGVALPRGVRLAAEAGALRLWALERPAPRARILRRTANAKDGAEAAAIAARGRVDPREVAVLERPLPRSRPQGRFVMGGPTRDRIRWRRQGLARLTLDVALARPAMVVLADAYDPGWRAWSNDRPLEPVAVDGALLGLYLGEGEHELRLRYRPEGWAAAGWLALVGVLCGLALLVGARRRAATRGGGGRPAPVRR